jgi:alkanesulfonate monooxygenase SsuD/methylene tetrahydromethanopterin reductase-like flavin-dependent oxidoreductase (luciferase family)
VRRRTGAAGANVDRLRTGGLVGTPDEIVDRISRYAEIGATRVYLQVMNLDDLDMIELMAERVLPQLR